MLRHVAMFRWTEEITTGQKAAVSDALARLPSLIPELREYRFGDDLGLVEGTWDFVVVADFDDVEGWRRYRNHPAHRQVIDEHITPVAAERAAVQHDGLRASQQARYNEALWSLTFDG